MFGENCLSELVVCLYKSDLHCMSPHTATVKVSEVDQIAALS